MRGALVVRAVVALILLTFFLAPPARADDVLLQAVSFAITGSDGSKVTAIDRARCVFKVEDDTYFLNNVYVDRISIRSWKHPSGFGWTTVDIHGNKKVVDQNSPAVRGTEAALSRLLGEPSAKGKTTAAADKTLMIPTTETERVVKAWEYIYANGCQGATSPF
jgi:hypothetical protein